MTSTSSKAMRVVVPAVIGVAVISAVVFGRARTKREAMIPAGTTMVAALEHRVSTEQSHVGDNVELRTVAPIYAGGGDVIPDGVTIYGTVTEARGGGRIAGAPELALRFTDLEVDGNRYPITADQFRVRGKNDALQSAAEIGGGAVAGGVLGRVIGGKGGTAPGAVAGAVIGTGVAVATEGDQLVLPAGQKLRIRLGNSVRVTYHPESETKTQ